MLVNKAQKYDEGDIVSFKIMNGDEVVARVESDNEEQYTLTKPLTVVPQGQGIGLMQSMFSADTSAPFVLKKSHVMLHGVTAEQLADHYREVTTGIKAVRRDTKIIV